VLDLYVYLLAQTGFLVTMKSNAALNGGRRQNQLADFFLVERDNSKSWRLTA
jgi:hypothetical protein